MAEYLIRSRLRHEFKDSDKKLLDYLTKKFEQQVEIDKFKQQTSASDIAEYLVSHYQELRFQNFDKEYLHELIDQLSQLGEMNKLKQSSALIVAEYIVKMDRVFSWKNTPWWRRWLNKTPEP